ncbi:glutamyl aminopeptidase isoform X2 [Dendroctonus ponderosae]|uniref:glutamyl aminopeptidase isoform X2 n=1 Tax=Dendroctonus ponderosae TaxID=77166 RepID=UPI00203503D2|nr:glutamyl aminopeptidase isoform X2 [Dendroctonus ponderosae]
MSITSAVFMRLLAVIPIGQITGLLKTRYRDLPKLYEIWPHRFRHRINLKALLNPTSCSWKKYISTTALPTTTTEPSPADMSKYRLPTNVKPALYDLFLYPDLQTGLFKGSVIISLAVSGQASSIVLHSNGLNITKVLVNEEQADFNVEPAYEIVTITRKDGSNFTSLSDVLNIEFNGDMKNRIVGLYTSSYSSDGKTTTIATSKFEPTYARQAFPCFDEPNMKAQYIVHLLKPKEENYIALSNYPVDKIDDYDSTNELVTFKQTVSMSTYLTCFIVSDFTYTNTTFNNSGNLTELRVYASPGNLQKTTYAGEVAKKVIEYYVEYFGIPYPLPKLDLVAIPDFVSGAMEHWGLVTFRETALLYTDTTHSSANKQRVATVVAHELAHSWFGNLVTMNWWNDLWLNEGFASYIEFKGTHAAQPDWQMQSQFQTSDLHSVLTLDATLSSHPIVVSVTTPDEITAIFDAISYNKGASILRMLENTVGEEQFRTGVTSYLNKYKFGNAETKNFLAEIQAAVSPSFDVSQLMDTFTIQMGYPVVNVTYDAAKHSYTLTQTRFLMDDNATYETNNTYGYKWTIPITYITDLGKSSELILFPYDKESISVSRPTDAAWLKFNYDQIGYYRVNYKEEQWRNLINVYTSLPIADRTHLLEETFSIAEAGQLSYTIPLDLSKKLSEETDYAPWTVASSKLQGISTYLSGSNQDEAFKKYIRSVVSNAYGNFTWNEGADDGHLKRLTRIVVLTLACTAEHPDCLSQVQEKFNEWINNAAQPLSQDLRGIVYKYGMVKAEESTWNKLLAVYQAETDATEKLKLINGLANVKNSLLLIRLLDLSKNETIVRSQDYFTVLGYISANPTGTDLVWDFVRQNWEYLVERFTLNDRYLGAMIRTITAKFATESKLLEMEEFFAKYPNAGAGATARKTALETVKHNIKWLSTYRSTVESWISNVNK